MALGVAILGTGRIVESGYVPAFKEVADAKLVAVLSREQARADTFAKQYGIPRGYSDLAALLADPAVDAVIVASPDTTHESQVIAAARAGKHILCEKPMSSTFKSCKPMAEAVRAAGVTFAMGFDNRFNQGLVRIKEMIEAGDVGTVRYAQTILTTAVSDPKNWRAAGDQSRYWAMSASGTHVLDIYRWFFGDPANVCAAYSAPVYGGEKDEVAIMVLDYPGRLLANLTVSAVLPEANRIEIRGEKGTIIGERMFGRTNREALLTFNGRQSTIKQTDPFVSELRDFVEAIKAGRQPSATLEDGVRNCEIMDVAWESKSLRRV